MGRICYQGENCLSLCSLYETISIIQKSIIQKAPKYVRRESDSVLPRIQARRVHTDMTLHPGTRIDERKILLVSQYPLQNPLDHAI
ncbi:hypothetical protein XENTR_v10005166 [Xenopus tropicalis]|nr:hypothetical protein XENTR_v10005166 [Xenopus tropicalis]